MLSQHIEPAGPEILPIALAFVDRLLGRRRLEKLEPVAGDEDCATGLIEPTGQVSSRVPPVTEERLAARAAPRRAIVKTCG